MEYLGIDIGGTKCSVVRGTDRGEIIEKVTAPTSTVNDPTRGYGIFIENMLSEAEKIK